MRLNRDVLISAIITYQDSFFKLLDHIDTHDGSLEFPESLYLNIFNNEICNHTDDSNIHAFLNISSLIENGVFIHNDKNTGLITIERVIVDLLRFLDIKRAKELTHFDFNHLRKRTFNIVSDIEVLDPESQDYQDAMIAFNQLMSETHSKIKENVNGLTAQVEAIAKTYKSYDEGSKKVSVVDLHKKVTTLYERYVLPCYEFINPEMEMVNTMSFSKSVEFLINYHSKLNSGLSGTAISIQFRKTAITSYYKDISLLARKLERFSNHLERDRNYFLAIESAFSKLMDNIIPLRHGKQRYKYLSPNNEIFTNFTIFDGLAHHKLKFSAKLNWNKETTNLRFKEYLTCINQSDINTKNNNLKPYIPRKSISQERQVLITKLLFKIEIPKVTKDLHLFIYNYLRLSIKSFSLADVLFGLEVLIPMVDDNRMTSSFKIKQLRDGGFFINYIKIELNEELANV